MKQKIAIFAAVAVVSIGGVLLIAGWGKSPWGSADTGPDLSGPLPKIASDQTSYNFGTMTAGTEKSHTFTIRNDGDAPLHIINLDKSCKCTKGTVARQWLQPGETTTVDVTWKPERSDPNFQQILGLETNDPRYAAPGKFNLVIKGSVDQIVAVDPPSEFKVGAVVEDHPTIVHGTIYSRILETFSIVGFEKENKLLTAAATPLQKEVLEKLKAKCGYDVELTLAPGIQVGSFKEKLTVKTDVNGGTDLPWFISGERYGPFRILQGQGGEWSPKHMRLNLGQFSAEKGNKAQLKMLVSGLEAGRELEFVDVRSDVAFVKLEMKADKANKTREQKLYSLTIEVAPGSPPATFSGTNVVKIHVKTNHPKAEQIEFKVSFVSL